MRSEAEIRREVETRLRRRGWLIVNGGLWLAVVSGMFAYTRYRSLGLGEPWTSLIILFMLMWLVFIGLHAFRVIYVELREHLIQRAIEHERRLYTQGDAYEKSKRDDTSILSIADDGELIDFAARDDEEAHAQRS